jgi:hypothetical protein
MHMLARSIGHQRVGKDVTGCPFERKYLSAGD